MFWERYLDLCNSVNKAPSAVALELGFSNAASSGWKNGSMPRQSALKKIADYFGVTVNYLLYGEEKTAAPEGSGLSEKDVKLLAWFRSLPPETQKAILYDADAPEGLV